MCVHIGKYKHMQLRSSSAERTQKPLTSMGTTSTLSRLLKAFAIKGSRAPGVLGEWVIVTLGQEIYKVSLGHFVGSESKEMLIILK